MARSPVAGVEQAGGDSTGGPRFYNFKERYADEPGDLNMCEKLEATVYKHTGFRLNGLLPEGWIPDFRGPAKDQYFFVHGVRKKGYVGVMRLLSSDVLKGQEGLAGGNIRMDPAWPGPPCDCKTKEGKEQARRLLLEDRRWNARAASPATAMAAAGGDGIRQAASKRGGGIRAAAEEDEAAGQKRRRTAAVVGMRHRAGVPRLPPAAREPPQSIPKSAAAPVPRSTPPAARNGRSLQDCGDKGRCRGSLSQAGRRPGDVPEDNQQTAQPQTARQPLLPWQPVVPTRPIYAHFAGPPRPQDNSVQDPPDRSIGGLQAGRSHQSLDGGGGSAQRAGAHQRCAAGTPQNVGGTGSEAPPQDEPAEPLIDSSGGGDGDGGGGGDGPDGDSSTASPRSQQRPAPMDVFERRIKEITLEMVDVKTELGKERHELHKDQAVIDHLERDLATTRDRHERHRQSVKELRRREKQLDAEHAELMMEQARRNGGAAWSLPAEETQL